MTASLTVTNVGSRAGADVPQLYLTEAAGDRRMRLLGFERVALGPGESQRVTMTVDRRLLGRFDGQLGTWHVAGGTYRVAPGRSAEDLVTNAEVALAEQRFGR
jgi:beta-glucosidase